MVADQDLVEKLTLYNKREIREIHVEESSDPSNVGEQMDELLRKLKEF